MQHGVVRDVSRRRQSRLARVALLALGCLLAPLLTGCASMMKYSGEAVVTRQEIPITSNPTGAVVFVDGAEAGITPLTVSMIRSRPHDVRIELRDYEPAEVRVKNSLNPHLLLNLFLLGGAPFGLAIDVVSGAWDDHLKPGKLHLELARTGVPAAPARRTPS